MSGPCQDFVRGHLLGFFLAALCRRSTSRITSSAARFRRMRLALVRTLIVKEFGSWLSE